MSTRIIKAAPGTVLTGANYPTIGYSAEETAFRATSPWLFLDADARYCKALGGSPANFRWRAALGSVQFKPFGSQYPDLISWGGRSAMRIGFGSRTNGSDGRGGQLIEVDETPIMQRGETYTLVTLARVPVPMTEGNTDGTIGGTIVGGRVASGHFRLGVLDTNGRIDHRHNGNVAPTGTADYRTGVPVVIVEAFDAVAQTRTERVNGVVTAAVNGVSYSEPFGAGDAALAWMIGGYGSTTTQGGTQLDIGAIALFRGRNLAAAGEASALAATEAYLMAERAKYVA